MKNLTWKRRIVANCTRLLILSPNGLRGFESHRFRQWIGLVISWIYEDKKSQTTVFLNFNFSTSWFSWFFGDSVFCIYLVSNIS